MYFWPLWWEWGGEIALGGDCIGPRREGGKRDRRDIHGSADSSTRLVGTRGRFLAPLLPERQWTVGFGSVEGSSWAMNPSVLFYW